MAPGIFLLLFSSLRFFCALCVSAVSFLFLLSRRGRDPGIRQYAHVNPVKRGLVRHPKDWPWSSFLFYSGRRESLIDINPV